MRNLKRRLGFAELCLAMLLIIAPTWTGTVSSAQDSPHARKAIATDHYLVCDVTGSVDDEQFLNGKNFMIEYVSEHVKIDDSVSILSFTDEIREEGSSRITNENERERIIKTIEGLSIEPDLPEAPVYTIFSGVAKGMRAYISQRAMPANRQVMLTISDGESSTPPGHGPDIPFSALGDRIHEYRELFIAVLGDIDLDISTFGQGAKTKKITGLDQEITRVVNELKELVTPTLEVLNPRYEVTIRPSLLSPVMKQSHNPVEIEIAAQNNVAIPKEVEVKNVKVFIDQKNYSAQPESPTLSLPGTDPGILKITTMIPTPTEGLHHGEAIIHFGRGVRPEHLRVPIAFQVLSWKEAWRIHTIVIGGLLLLIIVIIIFFGLGGILKPILLISNLGEDRPIPIYRKDSVTIGDTGGLAGSTIQECVGRISRNGGKRFTITHSGSPSIRMEINGKSVSGAVPYQLDSPIHISCESYEGLLSIHQAAGGCDAESSEESFAEGNLADDFLSDDITI